jgi:hypothetical protein
MHKHRQCWQLVVGRSAGGENLELRVKEALCKLVEGAASAERRATSRPKLRHMMNKCVQLDRRNGRLENARIQAFHVSVSRHYRVKK